WLQAAGSRDYDRGGKEIMETIGNPLSREEFIVQFMNMWPWTLCVIIQHFWGGVMVIPSLLKIMGGDDGDANLLQDGLLCLSIVSEMGWEIGDLMGWIYERYFTKGGKVKVPIGLVIMMALHHSLNMTLGIPMIMNYRDDHHFHWLVFDLQAAAAVALAVQEYTKLLDVSKPNQLFQFQFFTGVSLVVMLWTRGFHWIYNCGMLIQTFYQQEAWTYVIVGTLCSLIFSLFNVFICIIPCVNRFFKFLNKKAEYKSLPANADPKTRRASMMAMQDAAANVMVNQDGMQAELLDFLQSHKRCPKKSDRRDTLPANAFGSTQRRRRRSSSGALSVGLLRSSMGNFDLALRQLHMAGDLSDVDEKEE
ncbi:MAG: hypothetical protein SGILL_008127, partial [Bacillariaceae sp.]